MNQCPTPTKTTLASSRTPEPLANERTSSTMLTAEAPGFTACSARRHEAVFFFVRILGFGDAVAVEDQLRSFGQRNLRFGIISATQAQRQSALGVEKVLALARR